MICQYLNVDCEEFFNKESKTDRQAGKQTASDDAVSKVSIIRRRADAKGERAVAMYVGSSGMKGQR